MSRPLAVRVAPRAAAAIRQAAEWWAVNRPKAPHAFAEELERALAHVAAQPEIGARARDVELAGTRRILMARVQYYLYYRVLDEPLRIEVLALWHTSRGSPPPASGWPRGSEDTP